MNITSTSCCGVDEIDNLQDYTDPEKAMLAFCDQVFHYDRWIKESQDNLAGIYIFTGVERLRGTTEIAIPYTDKNRYKIGVRIGYGSAFAKFITVNKLGKVVAGQAAANRINHPNHIVKCWVWTPAVTALKRWYKEN